MPNWVYNTLEARGSEAGVHALVERLKRDESPISFSKIVPFPEGEEEDVPTGWGIDNWGTKWDACEATLEYDESDKQVATWHFQTAWSPPEGFFVALTTVCPDLRFHLRFVEEQGWGGEWEATNGEPKVLDSWDIPSSHADSVAHDLGCWCDDRDLDDLVEGVFRDCVPAVAERHGITLDPVERETACALVGDWCGTIGELIETSQRLIRP